MVPCQVIIKHKASDEGETNVHLCGSFSFFLNLSDLSNNS